MNIPKLKPLTLVQTRRYNYDTLWWSIVTSFQLFTGDGWANMLWDCNIYFTVQANYFIVSTISPGYAVLYITGFFLGAYLLRSLFLGMVLQQYGATNPHIELQLDPARF